LTQTLNKVPGKIISGLHPIITQALLIKRQPV
jgi:hypothetical protein